MSSVVLDASAVLALLLGERGGERVSEVRDLAVVSSVNACEVVERLLEQGYDAGRARRALTDLELEIADFTTSLALRAAALKQPTRVAGLSLGDRACLSLALDRGLPALTTDRDWLKVEVGVEVQVIR